MIARMLKPAARPYFQVPLAGRFNRAASLPGFARVAHEALSSRSAEPAPSEFYLIERWVQNHLGKIKHERRVLAIASTLFDLTRPLHEMGTRARRLLCAAALVHDVGRCISRPDHPEEGCRMILDDPSLPVTGLWRRWLAYTTLYHRDEVPPPGKDDVLDPTDDHRGLLLVLALLRSADALDSRSKESPRLVLSMNRRNLKVACFLREYSAKVEKLYRRRKKFRLLEDVLDCTVDVRVQCGEAIGVVG